MARRNIFRRSSPAASSRAARRSLSWAYGEEVTAALPGRVQLRDGLVEVDAYLADQHGGAVQGVEGIAQRRVRCHDHAPSHRQGCFGGERAACQPGQAGGVRQLGVLLVGEREPYRPAAPALVPGTAARPGTGRLAVAVNLVVAKNVRHGPSPFRCQPGANAP
jgi:hypothetical protein